MSDNEKIQDILEIPDPVVVGEGNVNKRMRQSSTASAKKKLKVDPTEFQPDSAPPSCLGNATDPDQQNPKSVQHEGEKQVQSDANDTSPTNEEGIAPGTVLNLTESKDQLQELPSTGSHLPLKEQSVTGNLDDGPEVALVLENRDEPIFESPHSSRFGEVLFKNEDEKQVQSDAIDTSPPNGEEISDNEDENLHIPYYHLPQMKTVVPKNIDEPIFEGPNSDHVGGVLVIDNDERQVEPDGNDASPHNELGTGIGILSDDQVVEQGEDLSPSNASPSQELNVAFDQDGSEEGWQQESLYSMDTEVLSPQQEYDLLVEEELRRNSGDFANSSEEGEEDGGSEGEEERTKAYYRDLERVTDLQPRVLLSKEHTAHVRDFKILRVIGVGGYGKVFVVRKLNGSDAGKVYAMKVVSKMGSIHSLQTASLLKTERQVLEAIQGYPFVVCLQYAFQTNRYLFLVMNYVQGGELFLHVQKVGPLPEPDVCLYLAEVVVAVQRLHNQNILYRDLKLENILMDAEGHIVLADFGLAIILTAENQYRAHDCCGTLEYMAPEVMQNTPEGYDKAVDWWSLGVLTLELITGFSPFAKANLKSPQRQKAIKESVLHEELQIPTGLSPNANDLVQKLLQKDPKMRLGGSEIREHPFFQDINWLVVSERLQRMPFRPRLNAADDVQHFDTEVTSQPMFLPQCEAPPSAIQLYRGFDYTAPKIIELTREHKAMGKVNRRHSV